MDNRPIGVMDSGIGGLTVFDQLKKVLPSESFIYVGDQANLPYGEKTSEEVYQLTKRIADYFLTRNVKMMVIACNTATAAAADRLKRELPIPVIGVIQPGAKASVKVTKNGNIGVIGTNGTVNSKSYERLILKEQQDANVFQLGCPDFVTIVEDGDAGTEKAREVVADQLKYFDDKNIDTLILGCTHFPIIEKEVTNAMPGVTLVDPGMATAIIAKNQIETYKIASDGKPKPTEFFTTGDNEYFTKQASTFLTTTITSNKLDL
ncbi:glutamate racemase [Lentilactobacillus sp. Marseille-Q4993]|uniref:glutamate racemase n=1 Tax=Lentilactobacillus sp. Marseille-Q4993 TaxID=3039492 RepID=UPI0032DF1125